MTTYNTKYTFKRNEFYLMLIASFVFGAIFGELLSRMAIA